MFISLIVMLVVILITGFWVYQGFFSSVLMLVESIIAATIAFAFYETLNKAWAEQLNPGIGLPLALMLIFVAVLFVLRFVTDKYIPGNVMFPMWVDRAGGGVCGLFTGIVLTGMVLISVQMLPLGASVFGFERFSTDKQGTPEFDSISPFSPDTATAGLVSMLSDGRFGGDNSLRVAKPDMVTDFFASRAAPQSESRVYLKDTALRVSNYWTTLEIDHATHSLEGGALVRNFEKREPLKQGHKFLVCAMSVATNAAKEGTPDVRFRLPQFRIVGPPPAGKDQVSPRPQVYIACGMTDLFTHKEHGPKAVSVKQAERLVRFSPTTDFLIGPHHTGIIKQGEYFKFDVAFEVPEDFEPWYVEFKRGARVDLSGKKSDEEAPDWAARAMGSGGESGKVDLMAGKTVGAAPGGKLHTANAVEERTGVSDNLPTVLSLLDSIVARHSVGGKIRGGDQCHFFAKLPEQAVEEAARVEKFDVPAGKKLLQIGAEKIEAKSLLARCLNFAGRVTAQVRVSASDGTEYFAIGQYAATKIGDEYWIEIQYYPDSEVPERALSGKKPKKVTRSILNKNGPENYIFGFLFVVNPGSKIVKFNAGRGKGQDLNIQVPN